MQVGSAGYYPRRAGCLLWLLACCLDCRDLWICLGFLTATLVVQHWLASRPFLPSWTLAAPSQASGQSPPFHPRRSALFHDQGSGPLVFCDTIVTQLDATSGHQVSRCGPCRSPTSAYHEAFRLFLTIVWVFASVSEAPPPESLSQRLHLNWSVHDLSLLLSLSHLHVCPLFRAPSKMCTPNRSTSSSHCPLNTPASCFSVSQTCVSRRGGPQYNVLFLWWLERISRRRSIWASGAYHQSSFATRAPVRHILGGENVSGQGLGKNGNSGEKTWGVAMPAEGKAAL